MKALVSKVLKEHQAEKLVLSMLKAAKKPLKTSEIEERTSAMGVSCPDSAARFLNKLRFKGVIKGKLSIDDKGWVWWTE